MSSNPTLIEPGVKYFFNQTLKQCNLKRMSLYNTLCNLGLMLLFIGLFGGILYYKKCAKKTNAELEENERQKQMYILSKLKNYNDVRLKERQDLITGLPTEFNDVVLQSYSYYK